MINILHETLPKQVIGIYLFGSHSRSTHMNSSDIDIVVVTEGPFQTNPNDFLSIPKDKQSDVYMIPIENLSENIVNPKVVTMLLDMQPLFVRKHLSFNPKFDIKSFCCFLEFEQYKNNDIFQDQAATFDWFKKVKHGRRTIDEYIWLSKLAHTSINYDQISKTMIKLSRGSVNFESVRKKIRQYFTKKTIELLSLITATDLSERSIQNVVLFDKEFKHIFEHLDIQKIEQLFEHHKHIRSMKSWLIIYIIAYMPFINEKIANAIVTMSNNKSFVYEFKKNLLQNRSFFHLKNSSNLLEILTQDKNRIVSTYAKILNDDNYLNTLCPAQKQFLKNNTNHLAKKH